MPVNPNPATEVTPEKIERFLAALQETCNVTDSARVAKIHRATIYKKRNSDPVFSEAFEKARELGIESLEDKAMKRAKYGTLKPVYQGGKKVGDVREYSDTLIIFLLKGAKPKKYKDRLETEHTGEVIFKVTYEDKPISNDDEA